jgi:hypothetical protein
MPAETRILFSLPRAAAVRRHSDFCLLTPDFHPHRIKAKPSSIEESSFQRYGYGVGTVVGAEFGKNAFHVRLDGGLGDRQLRRDDLVRTSLGDFPQNIHLAVG